MKRIVKIALVSIVLALFLGSVALITMAYTPPPMPPSTGGGSSGSGGGGGGSSYTAPVFQTYTKPLKSSDGTVIGRLEGKNFNSVLLWAEKNGTIGNASYNLTITGELTQQLPDNCWLDVTFAAPDAAGLPKGMDGGLVLAVVNVTGNPGNGWSYKANSLKYALKISNDTVKSLDPADTYYLVRSDGASYQVQKIDGAGVGLSPIAFGIAPPSDNGVFTIMEAVKPAPSPTPTPTPTPTATLTSTPTPENIGTTGIALSILMFVLGAIATAATMYLVFMRGKA